MTNDSLFFRLLRMGLGTLNEPEDKWDMIQGNRALSVSDCQVAISQGVGAFLFDGLQKAVECGMLPPDAVSREVKMKLFTHTMQVEKQCKKQYVSATELSSLFAANGIKVIVLKGIAAGTNYPNPLHRPCGDLDCFLFNRYKDGNRIAKEAGAEVIPFHYKHSLIKYKGLMVENHQFCTPIRDGEKTKKFERLLQSLLKEEGMSKIGETRLENPSPMFNALFLTFHGMNHFLLENIALRHLCDWAMLLHKHGDNIDWQLFMNVADEYGLRRFADAMTHLSEKWLGVEVPFKYKAILDPKREDALFEEILKGLPTCKDGSLWQQRITVFKNLVKNKYHFDLFSDISYSHFLFNTIKGFCFERNPHL